MINPSPCVNPPPKSTSCKLPQSPPFVCMYPLSVYISSPFLSLHCVYFLPLYVHLCTVCTLLVYSVSFVCIPSLCPLFVCLTPLRMGPLLVHSSQTSYVRSIDAMYVGCWYPGAAAKRPPGASRHRGDAKRNRVFIAATPGSSPLSMRLGTWSALVGKTRKTSIPDRMRKKGRKRRSSDEPHPDKDSVPYR